jgi:putative FmdB family regulatory protein
MPTYQYACTEPECGNRFELVQSFTDPSVTECPVCNGTVRKVYGSVGVVFKGSGFYRTDSRAGNGAKDSGGDAKESTKKSDTKSDAKSDSSSSSKAASKSDSSSSSSSTSTASSSGKAAASA